MKLAFFLMTLSVASSAQMLEGDFLKALEGSDWAEQYQTSPQPEPQVAAKDPQIEGARTSQDLNCNQEKDQNTIPYRFLLGLMGKKALDISHDPHSGVLRFDGGVMVGNCHSMLETVMAKPNENIPYYSFQLAVKRPSGCKGAVCVYDVTRVENGKNIDVKMTFEPSFSGFISCLKGTGVFANGKIVKSKVVPREFAHEERGVTLSSEVVYANRGFKGARYVGKFSGNKLPNYPGCYYFEDMKKGGFKTTSVDDMESYEMEKLYQKVCNSGNYKLIDSHIADFDKLEPFQNSLTKIRNELILKEVAALHNIVSESSDLSEVDKAKFKEVTSDFLEHVIKPLKNDLAQLQRLYENPGHSQKEGILKSIFSPEKAEELLGKDPKTLKEAIAKELDARASLLVDYARAPYLTKADFDKMQDNKKGAPMDSATWTSSVLDVFEIHNTAFNYGRYSKDFWESNYKDNPKRKGEKRFAKASILDEKIDANVRKQRKYYNRVSEVIANPDMDYSKNYANEKAQVLESIDAQIRKKTAIVREAFRKVHTQCSMEKAQKYWINQQACVKDALAQIEACAKEIEALKKARSEAIRKYDALIAENNEVRKKAGYKVSDYSDTKPSSSKKDGSFTFTPTQPAKPNVGNQYSQQMQQFYQQQYLQQQSRNSRLGNFGLNGSLGWNLSAGGGSSMYGMPSNPYNPSYGYNRMPANSYYGMSPAMGYFGQTNTMPGGRFSFGMGAGGGLPAYSPMAPQGGAGTSFSFGF